MTKKEFKELSVLADIREAIGDPEGKLMQDELVEKIKNIKEAEERLREGVFDYIKDEGQTRDTLKHLLKSTKWWD